MSKSITAEPNAESGASLAPSSGSVAKPQTISEWFRYLTQTNQLHDYWNDGSEKSKAIQDGFGAWKAKQGGEAEPLNDQAHARQ